MSDRRNSESKDMLSFGPFSLFAAERLLKRVTIRYRSAAARSTS
jgi:hypothetical protein